MEKLFIIKIGGNVVDNEVNLTRFLQDFATINANKILIHGGGKIATSIGDKMGIISEYIDGRRITDDQTIDLVTMVYGGLVNKKITAILQSEKVDAIGLTGADANLIPAIKRPVRTIDYGWVGDICAKNVSPQKWSFFINNNLVPVVAPLTHDGRGNILNTNADTIASVLAVSLSRIFEVTLLYCFEKAGVLEDVNDENSVISHLSGDLYDELKGKNLLFEGILPKIDNAFDALRSGVAKIVIGNSSELTALINGTRGTLLQG